LKSSSLGTLHHSGQALGELFQRYNFPQILSTLAFAFADKFVSVHALSFDDENIEFPDTATGQFNVLLFQE